MSAPVTVFYEASSVNNAYTQGIALPQTMTAGVPLILVLNETANTSFSGAGVPFDYQQGTVPYPYIFYDQFRQIMATSADDLSAVNFNIVYIDRLGYLLTVTQPGPNAETLAWEDAVGEPLLAQRIISVTPDTTLPTINTISLGWGTNGQTNYMFMDYMRAYWNATVEVWTDAPLVGSTYTIFSSSLRLNTPQNDGTVTPPVQMTSFPLGTVAATTSQRIHVPLTTSTLWVEVTKAASPFNTGNLWITFLQQGVR